MTVGDGPMEGDAGRPELDFEEHHAFIVGIDEYPSAPLKTAVSDASRLAEVLRDSQSFRVSDPLLNAGRDEILALLDSMQGIVHGSDRVVFYFAGHGIGRADGDIDGPAGYLVPVDGDAAIPESLIAMEELYQALDSLKCRHLLLVLDCCNAGAFKQASETRAFTSVMPKRIYQERFDRFVRDPAWQVITSAAYDQEAFDVDVAGAVADVRGVGEWHGFQHSPFASALFRALSGEADASTSHPGDGVITATEVYSYVRDQVEPKTETELGKRQTPSFFSLRKHNKGEFVFLHPKHRLNLPPLPDRNPYMGLAPGGPDDAALFSGRDDELKLVRNLIDEGKRLVVVTGGSGSGKSSLLNAGVGPDLRSGGYTVHTMSAAANPLEGLERALKELTADGAPTSVLLIDQLDALVTRHPESVRNTFIDRLQEVIADHATVQCVVAVRSGHESLFKQGALANHWAQARVVLGAISPDAVREMIERPANTLSMDFDPGLVKQITNEATQAPSGALPWLSETLSALYDAYVLDSNARVFSLKHYERTGGIACLVQRRADELYQELGQLDAADGNARQEVMRRIILRMVAVDGKSRPGRQVSMSRLEYSPDWNPIVLHVIEKLVDARLVFQDAGFVEPTHDSLVNDWKMAKAWRGSVSDGDLRLDDIIAEAAEQWHKDDTTSLWKKKDSRLAIAAASLETDDHRLNLMEETFITKSVARNNRTTRLVSGLAAAALVILAGLTIWALQSAFRANEQTVLAKANASEALLQAARANEQTELAEANEDRASEQTELAKANASEALLQADRANEQTGLAKANADLANEQTALAQAREREAVFEKQRTLQTVFEGLRLGLGGGWAGSLCTKPVPTNCVFGRPIPGVELGVPADELIIVAKLPDDLPGSAHPPPTDTVSRTFVMALEFGEGRVVAFAHDGIVIDAPVRYYPDIECDTNCPVDDNLTFFDNAIRWTVSSNRAVEDCGSAPRVLLLDWWVTLEGTQEIAERLARREWPYSAVDPSRPLAGQLECAATLVWGNPWEMSDLELAAVLNYVANGGGLVLGGLGWSFAEDGTYGPPEEYPAARLAQAFGFAFSRDAYPSGAIVQLSPP